LTALWNDFQDSLGLLAPRRKIRISDITSLSGSLPIFTEQGPLSIMEINGLVDFQSEPQIEANAVPDIAMKISYAAEWLEP
jgi:hypothetical protein